VITVKLKVGELDQKSTLSVVFPSARPPPKYMLSNAMKKALSSFALKTEPTTILYKVSSNSLIMSID
jgi:hypothetical protein